MISVIFLIFAIFLLVYLASLSKDVPGGLNILENSKAAPTWVMLKDPKTPNVAEFTLTGKTTNGAQVVLGVLCANGRIDARMAISELVLTGSKAEIIINDESQKWVSSKDKAGSILPVNPNAFISTLLKTESGKKITIKNPTIKKAATKNTTSNSMDVTEIDPRGSELMGLMSNFSGCH